MDTNRGCELLRICHLMGAIGSVCDVLIYSVTHPSRQHGNLSSINSVHTCKMEAIYHINYRSLLIDGLTIKASHTHSLCSHKDFPYKRQKKKQKQKIKKIKRYVTLPDYWQLD